MTLEREISGIFGQPGGTKGSDPKPSLKSENRDNERAAIPVALPWRAFPCELLPEPFRRYVTEWSAAIGCDPSMVALPTLAEVASVIGTTRRIQLKRSWQEAAVLWTSIIAESGTLKSPAQESALAPLYRLQADEFRAHDETVKVYERDRLEYERELIQWKRKKDCVDPPEKPDEPHAERLVCNDTTLQALAQILEANPRGVLLARDELAGWLGSFDQFTSSKGSDAAQWLELHRAGPLIVDRKTDKRTTYIPRAAVSIAGTIQPETLRRCLGREHFKNGLAARLLLAMPPRQRKRWRDADVSPRTVEAFADVLVRLRSLRHSTDSSGELVPVDVPLSADGRKAWIRFFNEHAEREFDASGDLAAAFSKLEAYAARFALVFHFVKWASAPDFNGNEIGVDCIEAGAALARWFCNEAERVYGMFAETDEDREARELVEYIRSRGGSITVNDLRHGPRRFRDSTEAARLALAELVGLAAGVWDHATGTKGGRPSERFVLHTQSGTGTETRQDRKGTGV